MGNCIMQFFLVNLFILLFIKFRIWVEIIVLGFIAKYFLAKGVILEPCTQIKFYEILYSIYYEQQLLEGFSAVNALRRQRCIWQYGIMQ